MNKRAHISECVNTKVFKKKKISDSFQISSRVCKAMFILCSFVSLSLSFRLYISISFFSGVQILHFFLLSHNLDLHMDLDFWGLNSTSFHSHYINLTKVFPCSVQFSRSVVSDSLRPHESQYPGLPVHHQLPEFTQIHVHRVRDAIQSSHWKRLWCWEGLRAGGEGDDRGWVNSSHEVAKVLEFQL